MRTHVLVLGAGCIIGCAAWLLFGRWAGDGPSGSEAALVRPATLTPASIVDALSMPLFSVRQAVVPQAAPPVSTGDLRLVGISFTPRRRAALLSSGGQRFWLAVGQSRDGVTVTKLERTAVELQGAGDIRRLELFKTPRPALPATAVGIEQPRTRAREPASAPGLPPVPPVPKGEPAPQPKAARE